MAQAWTMTIFQEFRKFVALAIITSPNRAAPQQRHSKSQSACRKISKMLSLIRFSMKGSSCKTGCMEHDINLV